MVLNLTVWRLFLAQTESSSVTDFIGQISGLVGLTCAAGFIWIVLTAFVLQRAAERRRRAAQGLEPLPSVYESVWRALRSERSEARSGELALESGTFDLAPHSPVLAPDLALLTGEQPAQQGTPDPVPAPRDETLDEAPPPVEQESVTMPEQPDLPAADEPDPKEGMRVWRDRATGALLMEIDGKRIYAAEALRTAALRQRVSDIVSELNALLEPPDAPPSAGDPALKERPAPRSGSTLRQIGRVALGQSATEAAQTGPRSIADQIEDLLQSRLERDPAFRGRAIHVRPSLQGGVNIVVDDRRYEGIGEIDDPDVRALLEDVVREWEATQ